MLSLFHPAFARSGTVDQMFHDQSSGFLVRELRQRHRRSQQFPHIGDRQCRQVIDRQLAIQLGVAGELLLPLEFGLGHEPRCQNGQSQLMFPGTELLGLQLIPAHLRLGVLNGALDEVALGLQPGQFFQGRLRVGIAEGVAAIPVSIRGVSPAILRWVFHPARSTRAGRQTPPPTSPVHKGAPESAATASRDVELLGMRAAAFRATVHGVGYI